MTSNGATYDAAGDMTSDGTTNYTFDEMNRMTEASGTFGAFGYSYSPGENKRMVVYGSSSNSQTLTIFFYAPNGKVLSQLAYQKNGSNWAPIAINALTNYLYLGGKPLSYAENNVSSNASGTYWPYGSTNTNPTTGPSTFATYLGDWSTLYYADQRYYDYNWGRFLTADPSSANVSRAASITWDKYAYLNGDPVNGMDPAGLGSLSNEQRIVAIIGGSTQLVGNVLLLGVSVGGEVATGGLSTPISAIGTVISVGGIFGGTLNVIGGFSGDDSYTSAGPAVSVATNPISAAIFTGLMSVTANSPQTNMAIADGVGSLVSTGVDGANLSDPTWSVDIFSASLPSSATGDNATSTGQMLGNLSDMIGNSWSFSSDALSLMPGAQGFGASAAGGTGGLADPFAGSTTDADKDQ